ncbi:general secretion pathway protein [Candidimonas humi]|uniref:General secretion pathway protein n=1 Tax=Candidimonas humi TaxID=683355 RepID=A0ABV8NV83_9BURK|nr:general secretion pathway protein [Candidimonas humi]
MKPAGARASRPTIPNAPGGSPAKRVRAAGMLHDAVSRLAQAFDGLLFGSRRADYYEYLAALMQGEQGRRTLHGIFLADAARYGSATLRGRLARRWAQTYQDSGGSLLRTWGGSLPAMELGLIAAAQSQGNEALARTLHDLGQVARLVGRARELLFAALWPALVALLLLSGLVLAVPAYTAPRLRQTFQAVPDEYLGILTRRLFEFSAWVQAYWPMAVAGLAASLGLLLWSLPNLTGALRAVLDRHGPWRLYRHFHAVRFLAVLGAILERPGAGSMRLAAALGMQKACAAPWAEWHIDAMLGRIDAGVTGAATLDTGLLDRELYWFLADMALARGLEPGLLAARERLLTRILVSVAHQAAMLRWSLLLACVAGLLGLGLWHYAVIDELRRALTFFYASQ